MAYTLPSGWKMYGGADKFINTSQLPTQMASYGAGGSFKAADMSKSGSAAGAGAGVMGSVAQFAADLIEANGMAKAGGAAAAAAARSGLGRMGTANKASMGLGSPKRLGYWLGGG